MTTLSPTFLHSIEVSRPMSGKANLLRPEVLQGMWKDSQTYRGRDSHRTDQWAENRTRSTPAFFQPAAVSDRGGLRGSKATKQS